MYCVITYVHSDIGTYAYTAPRVRTHVIIHLQANQPMATPGTPGDGDGALHANPAMDTAATGSADTLQDAGRGGAVQTVVIEDSLRYVTCVS